MTDTRQALAALLPCPFCGNSKGLAVANENPQDLSGGYFIACPSCDASTGLRFACGEDPIPLLIEQWNRRAALSAQPVAGAVATDNQLEPVLEAWFVTDGTFYERMRAALSAQPVAGAVAPEDVKVGDAVWFRMGRMYGTPPVTPVRAMVTAYHGGGVVDIEIGCEGMSQISGTANRVRWKGHLTGSQIHDGACWWHADLPGLRQQEDAPQAAPAPEPSDESECEHATIRYMLDAAQPEPSTQGRPCPFGCTTQEEHDAHQSAEPSAQGEPVAWRPGDPIYDDAYVRGVAVGFAEDDSRRTTLLRIADRIEARASAPSTSPPAVVEAVPIPDCTVADVGFRWDMEAQRHVPQVLVEFEPTPPNSPVDAKGWKDRNAFAALVKSRGIAPKAAQP